MRNCIVAVAIFISFPPLVYGESAGDLSGLRYWRSASDIFIQPCTRTQNDSDCISESETKTVKVSAKDLKDHLHAALEIQEFYFYDSREDKIFKSYKNGKVFSIEKAVHKRLRNQKNKISAILEFQNQTSSETSRLHKIANGFAPSSRGQKEVPEANLLLKKWVEGQFNATDVRESLSAQNMIHNILLSYTRTPPDLDFIALPGVNGKPYASMQRTTVTQIQWHSVMGWNPSVFSDFEYCPESHQIISGVSMCPEHPVETVTFLQMQVFLHRLQLMNQGSLYRLPTAEEWESVARARSNGSLDSKSWYIKNSHLQTHPVKKKQPNSLGFYDISGNVWTPVTDPTYIPIYRIENHRPEAVIPVRGGSWFDNEEFLHPNFKGHYYKEWSCYDVGIRLVRTTSIP